MNNFGAQGGKHETVHKRHSFVDTWLGSIRAQCSKQYCEDIYWLYKYARSGLLLVILGRHAPLVLPELSSSDSNICTYIQFPFAHEKRKNPLQLLMNLPNQVRCGAACSSFNRPW